MRILLVSFLISLCYLGWATAQDAPATPPSSGVQSAVKATSSTPSPNSQTAGKTVEKSQVAPATSTAQTSTSQNDPNAFKKEQRLEELRYRHLWIAFSLVWLITLVFVYGTWQRSQAVASRLDELKARLAQVEKEKEEE